MSLDKSRNFSVFEDKGKDFPIPPGYKDLKVHFVYDVKPDGTRKARFVAVGHLIPLPANESSYSSVVSLRGLRLVIFIAELNKLQIWGTDIGNAYIQAFTKELLFV